MGSLTGPHWQLVACGQGPLWHQPMAEQDHQCWVQKKKFDNTIADDNMEQLELLYTAGTSINWTVILQYLVKFSGGGASQVAQMVKCLPAMQETRFRSLDWEDPLGEENGNPLQNSCLENSMDGRSLVGYVHGVAKSQIQLNDFTSLHFSQVKDMSTCVCVCVCPRAHACVFSH